MSLRGAEFLHHRLQLFEVELPRSAHVVPGSRGEKKHISIWLEKHLGGLASHSGFINDVGVMRREWSWALRTDSA